MPHRTIVVLISALALLTLQGCFDISLGPDVGPDTRCKGNPGQVSWVQLTRPPSDNLAIHVGDSVIVTAELIDKACEFPILDLEDNWSSSAPAILSIRPLPYPLMKAVVVARDVGTATISVSIDNVEGAMAINVVAR